MNFCFWSTPKLVNLKEFGQKQLFLKWFDATLEHPIPFESVLIQYEYESLTIGYWHNFKEDYYHTLDYSRIKNIKRWADIKPLTNFKEIYLKDVEGLK